MGAEEGSSVEVKEIAMPSVITIEGGGEVSELEEAKKKGEKCKWVKNPRTGCEVELCFVGKAKSRTGWKFVGSARCSKSKKKKG